MIWMERRKSERMDEGKEGRERREGKTLIKIDVIREIAATGCVLEYDLFGQEVMSLFSTSPSSPHPLPPLPLLLSCFYLLTPRYPDLILPIRERHRGYAERYTANPMGQASSR